MKTDNTSKEPVLLALVYLVAFTLPSIIDFL